MRFAGCRLAQFGNDVRVEQIHHEKLLVMYLLDTNVISELRKAASGKAHPNVTRWAQGVPASILFLSVVTILELDIGLLLMERRNRIQGERLRVWLDEQILPSFAG